MLKYAKIIDEKTKQCFVGLNNLDDIYCDEIAYDENGNPYELKMTYKKYYESIGMSEIEVEQAVCGQWYLQGYIPEPTVEEKEAQVRAVRDTYLQHYDFTQLPDVPFTELEKEQYANYRRYLRDYTTLPNWWEQNPMTFEEWSV